MGQGSYVVRFADLGRGDVAVAGGKGANLGELTRAGLPVPPGFVLATAAYRAFVEEVESEILALAARAEAAGIRALITSREIPEGMAREITDAWTALGGGPVAVRSSATAEDLEGASFAGQQDTYLNVRGAAALLGAVRECWASLWTDRAVAYRARQGIEPAEVALAVVVQSMVEADAAGVMFTANPTNGRRDELVVSAAWGLGESVVSGSVTTDDLVVEKDGLRVTARTTADKAVMTVYAAERTAEVAVPPERRTLPVLDDKAAAVLAELGVRIEQHYGAPQDVEWARAAGEFFVVQARPITALPEPEAPPPTEWPLPDPKAFYFRASIVEQLPDPLSPLFEGLVDGSVERSLRHLMRELSATDVGPGDIGLPTVNGYAYYRYSRAALWRMTVASRKAMRLLPAIGQKQLARGRAPSLRRGRRGLARPPARRPHRRAAPRRRAGAAGRGHGVLHGRPGDHPAGRVQRAALHGLLRQARAQARRTGGGDVPARLRQHADPGREVALRPRDVDQVPRRAGRGLRCAPTPRPSRRAAGPRPPTSGAPGSARTSTASATPPTTSTSCTRRRSTTRPRCSRPCASPSTAAGRAPTPASPRRRPAGRS